MDSFLVDLSANLNVVKRMYEDLDLDFKDKVWTGRDLDPVGAIEKRFPGLHRHLVKQGVYIKLYKYVLLFIYFRVPSNCPIISNGGYTEMVRKTAAI